MTKLFVDTNIYLDFYRSANDRLSLFEELKKLGNTLIISEQGYKEFQRNRAMQLTKLASEIERTTSISIYSTAMIQDMAEYKEASQLQSKIREIGKGLKKRIEVMLDGSDPVLEAYKDLIQISTFIETKEELIAKAKVRKILGNPPTSPDRHSIGDELLWEEIINCCDENLVIVSKDKTFTENKKVLMDEFSNVHPQKNLAIVKTVSEALKILGKSSDRLEATEAEMIFNTKILSKIADVIMEITIRKSSSIVLKDDQEGVNLTISNVRLYRGSSDKNEIFDAMDELIQMQLIEEVNSNIYELTEKGRTYEPLCKRFLYQQ